MPLWSRAGGKGLPILLGGRAFWVPPKGDVATRVGSLRRDLHAVLSHVSRSFSDLLKAEVKFSVSPSRDGDFRTSLALSKEGDVEAMALSSGHDRFKNRLGALGCRREVSGRRSFSHRWS